MQDWIGVERFWNRLWLDTVRLWPDSLFNFLDLLKLGAVRFPCFFWNILCWDMRGCPPEFLWQCPFVWNLGHMMVSFNFSQKSMNLTWNFSQVSPSFILNSGTWSLFLAVPYALFFPPLSSLPSTSGLLHFPLQDYCQLVLFFCLGQSLHHLLLLIRLCLLEWSLLGEKKCWICWRLRPHELRQIQSVDCQHSLCPKIYGSFYVKSSPEHQRRTLPLVGNQVF